MRRTTKRHWRRIVSAVGLVGLGACRTDATGAVVKDAVGPATATGTTVHFPAVSAVPALTCDVGDATSVVLVAAPAGVAAADLAIPPDFIGSPVPAAPPSPQRNIRLDVCANSDVEPATALLKRILILGNSAAGVDVVTPVAHGDGVALAHVLFGEPAAFTLRVPNESQGAVKTAYLLKSWVSAGTAGLAFINVLTQNDGPDTGINATFGLPVVGDLVADTQAGTGSCAGQPAHEVTYKIETARFTVKGCLILLSAGTVWNFITAVAVTDTNAVLPASVRGVPFTVDATHIENVQGGLQQGGGDVGQGAAPPMSYVRRTNHHNVCNSFVLTLPHATYAATAAPFGETAQGCSAAFVLPGAPTRDAQDQSASFYYRVRYGSGTAMDFTEPCGANFDKDCVGTPR